MNSITERKLEIAEYALRDILLNIYGTNAMEIADRANLAIKALDTNTRDMTADAQADERNSRVLKEVAERPRVLDRDDACEPDTVSRVLADLDAAGPSEAGDCIHSLLWKLTLVENRSKRFAQELMRRATFDKVSEDAAELNASFDLRHKADMRAIEMWRQQTGRELVMPDQADLCIWLLGELEKAGAAQQANGQLTSTQRKTLEGVELLFNMAAEHGLQPFFDDGTPTPNRDLCLRFAGEIRDLLATEAQGKTRKGQQ